MKIRGLAPAMRQAFWVTAAARCAVRRDSSTCTSKYNHFGAIDMPNCVLDLSEAGSAVDASNLRSSGPVPLVRRSHFTSRTPRLKNMHVP
jgi:hypothetical protein